MKYCVLIMDGAADWPLGDRGNKTCLELAETPNLTRLAREGQAGSVLTIPRGMEPSSACACMSLLGYDPRVYYKGRAAIEAVSMGVPIGGDEVVFRCNFVSIENGNMKSYCAGGISSEEGRQLVQSLNESLGSDIIRFFPGVAYRHLLKLKARPETAAAVCTPPHDIPGRPIAGYLPHGEGSDLLRELISASEEVLKEHPVNIARRERGQMPVSMIWLFWGSGRVPGMPPFQESYGLKAAITSGVDLLRGLGRMMSMDILEIPGVTDNLDNDFKAQTEGALAALEEHDLAVIHIEAADEAGHAGNADDKIEAIRLVDKEVIGRLIKYPPGELRLLVMPDHPTPIKIKTHAAEPVPFILWGPGFSPNGAQAFTEAEAKKTGLFIGEGYKIMGRFTGKF